MRNHIVFIWTIRFNVKQVRQKPLSLYYLESCSILGILHLSRLKKHQHASSNPVYHQQFYLVGHSFVFSSDWNNIFLIDWLFRWMLRRACSALLYSWRSGGLCNPSSRSKVKPWLRIRGDAPGIFILFMSTK